MTSETQDATQTKVDVKIESTPAGPIATITTETPPEDGWTQIRDQALQILSELPEYLGSFFSSYQKPLVTVGLILSAIVSLRVLAAVLDAINDIPLLAPTFELIGLGYTAWFVNRYLLRASNRKELSVEIDTLKGQVIGNKHKV
ncbi:CAAD domain-containing protein [Ancylothrix sp. C2]|uniref:CAAD domain-containing protein n=1 Tax=Ancylothrix sp. D3o TaxID=2953691 RepID=UPI0021BB6F72|nr:CAAD domain-containing protein [Ancylothrix sp. D3o]MCT7950304.1 CAAD domain-containing protein [Ancylothrix sp. D3o]